MKSQAPGASAPTVFTFTAQSVRVVVIDEAPWFVAADVLAALTLDRKALERLDDDEKGVSSIHTPGGTQEMGIINESGLYSLILGSRKPEAKKFKKWVTSEVLPAIRKTGTYSVQQPVPEAVHETLSPADMANLTRMVWLICGRPAHRQAWVQAVWYRLRQVCQCPAPNRFQVRHLPLLAAEVKRLAEVSLAFIDVVSAAERTLISRVIRQGEDEAPILTDLASQVQAQAQETRVELHKHMQRWVDMEYAPLVERRQTRFMGNAEFEEPAA